MLLNVIIGLIFNRIVTCYLNRRIKRNNYCEKCGSKIGVNTVYCANCGQKVGERPNNEMNEKNEVTKNSISYINKIQSIYKKLVSKRIVLFILIIFVISAVISMLTYNGMKENKYKQLAEEKFDYIVMTSGLYSIDSPQREKVVNRMVNEAMKAKPVNVKKGELYNFSKIGDDRCYLDCKLIGIINDRNEDYVSYIFEQIGNGNGRFETRLYWSDTFLMANVYTLATKYEFIVEFMMKTILTSILF